MDREGYKRLNVEYFNKVAPKWDTMIYHDPQKIARFFDLLGIREGDIVLDVGTGTGILIPYIIERIGTTGRLYAIDISYRMIEIASKRYRYPNLTLILGDVEEYDFGDLKFDKIICYSVFPHFSDQKEAIRKLSLLLRPSGIISVFHSASREYINNIHRENGFRLEKNILPPGNVVSQMMELAGLTVIHCEDGKEIYLVMGKKRYMFHKK